MLSLQHTLTYVQEHKTAFIIGGMVVCTLTLLFVFGTRSDTNVRTTPLYQPPTEKDWVQGDLARAKGVLIVYSDFECPACDIYHGTLTQLKTDLGDDLAIVYRHFPLSAIHPNAELAARAAESAGVQGKFFEMGDALFREQRSWAERPNARELFITYAKHLELDEQRFTADLDAKSIEKKVLKDEKVAREIGLTATPSFFLNGTYIPAPKTYAEFKTLVTQTIYGSSH